MSSNTKLENPKLWPCPFGEKADVIEIPNTVNVTQSAEFSMEYGFPYLTEVPEEKGGRSPQRAAFNSYFKALGDHSYFLQQGGVYQYDPAVAYKRNAVIMYDGVLYQSLQASNQGHNPAQTASADWWKKLIPLSTINGQAPDSEGNITVDMSGMAELEGANEFTGDNAFKGKVRTAELPEFSGKNMPDARAVKDTEFATMGMVREHVQSEGGGASGEISLVEPVEIFSPVNQDKQTSVFLNFVGSAYQNVYNAAFNDDPRRYREIQVTRIDDNDWRNATVFTQDTDELSLIYDKRLTELTQYKLRARDVSAKNRRGNWSKTVVFTTGYDVCVITPRVVSITGHEQNQVTENPEIICSVFETNTGMDSHEWTNWQVRSLPDNAVVYESTEDRSNLTRITLPMGILKESQQYEVCVQYHGRKYGDSGWCNTKFTTAARFTYVAMPTVSIEGGNTAVMSRPIFNSSAFRLVTTTGAVDDHRATSWQVESRDEKPQIIWESKEDREHLRTITMPAQLLEPDSGYRVKVKYHGRFYTSQWGEENFITAQRFEHVKKPELTIDGAPDNVPETPVLRGGNFTCLPAGTASDTHASTDWVIYNAAGDSEIWASRNDVSNLTSITIPKSVLRTGETYLFTVTYNGKKYGPSDRAEAAGTTRANFTYIETPKLTVEGGPADVRETPVLTGSEFKVVSDAGESDTHSATHWKVTKVDTGAVVYEVESDSTNLVKLTLPGGVLEPATAYRFQVAYIGAKHGKSSFATTDATTHSTLAYINAPTLTVQGHPASIGQTPQLSGTPFSVFSDNQASDVHSGTDWQVKSTTDGSTVWEALKSDQLTSITVPAGKLLEGTEYVFRMRYHGTRLAPTEWIEVRGTTMTTFEYITAPTITIKGGTTNVMAAPTFTGSAFVPVSNSDGTDTHESTEWQVVTAADPNTPIWQKTETASGDLLSVTMPKGQLHTSTAYKVKVRYKGAKMGYSAWSELAFTTAAEFTTVQAPLLTVEQDNYGVYEAPYLTTSAFVNSELEGDQHVATDWKVMKADDRSSVWSSLSNTTEKRYLQLPGGKLKPATRYIFAVRFKGASSDWSPWTEVTGTTQDTFYDNNAPTLANANIDRAGNKLRFEFSTPQLYTRPGKTKATHVRVKVRNKTKSDDIDAFTTEVTATGNYIVERENAYELSEHDDIEFTVFYKGSNADNDDNPLSAVSTRKATVNENIIVMLEHITGGGNSAYTYPSFTISLNFGAQTFEHTKTDWDIKDATNTNIIWSSIADTKHKTTIHCTTPLNPNSYYVLNVKAYGRKSSMPAESAVMSIKFKTSEATGLGIPGTAGFGVGVAPAHAVKYMGFDPMEGCNDPASANYGNYTDKNGNEWVYIPAFCYSFDREIVGSELLEKTPSAFAVKPFAEFEYSEEKANAANYVLHRAFIDGGESKQGFFITKYLVSKGNKSKKNTIAISITNPNHTDAAPNDYVNNPECKNVAADAIRISKKMTDNKGTCESVFMFAAMAMLSFVHGLHSQSVQYCAWHDASGEKNFPKGCNNGSLGDYNDPEIQFECSDSKQTTKGNTGGANHIAKCSHNGQLCGVIDLNGILSELCLGWISMSSNTKRGFVLVLKETATINDITPENVQTENKELYEWQKILLPTTTSSNGQWTECNAYWGHTSQNVFHTEASGFRRACCGVWPAAAENGSGTNEFGNDRSNADWFNNDARRGLMDCGGHHGAGKHAGIFTRTSGGNNNHWETYSEYWGFRAAAYHPNAAE